MGGLRTGKDGSQACYLLGWFLACHTDTSCLLGSVWLPDSGRTCFSCSFSLPSFPRKALHVMHALCFTKVKGMVDSYKFMFTISLPDWVDQSVHLSFSSSLPVIFMCCMYHLLFCTGQTIWKSVQGPWFLCSLVVYKMDLWNENQISHMNLLTPVIFHLLPTAMLRIRFSEECMDFCIYKGFFTPSSFWNVCPVQWQKGYFCN